MRNAIPHCLLPVVAPLYEFLFTPVCCHCAAPIRYGDRFLCRSCFDTLVPFDERDSLYQDAVRRLTGDGLFDGLVSLYRFEKGMPLQSLLHALKYGGRMGAGILLGQRLGAAVGSALRGEQFAGCLPVPLHRIRRRERGYNQSTLLCRGIAGTAGVPLCRSVMMRVRSTPSQTSLGSGERAANVGGAFAVRRRAIRGIAGRSFLLVDDVLTTGATLRACGAVLRDAGVRRLVACTVALAS